MNAIEIRGLSKVYSIRSRATGGRLKKTERVALRNVDLDVPEGEVFGVIGRNGAGKSTLLKVLCRIVYPSSGQAIVRGRVAALLEVGTGMHPEMTGLENIYVNGALLGMSRREITDRLDQIVEFAGVGEYLETPIKRYSSGMVLRLAFSVAAFLAADVMIIDEVLAVGDAEFQKRCLGAMSDAMRRGRTTLFVSHNMAAVEHLCTSVAWLDRGVLRAAGSPREVVQAYLREAVPGSEGLEWLRPAALDTATQVVVEKIAVTGGAHPVPVQGEDVVIRLGVRVTERVTGLQCLVRLMTAEGIPVTATTNGDLRQEWTLDPGRYEAEVRFLRPWLLPQRYTVSVQMRQGWGVEVYEDLREVVAFDVEGADLLGTGVMPLGDRGAVYLPTEFQVRPA